MATDSLRARDGLPGRLSLLQAGALRLVLTRMVLNYVATLTRYPKHNHFN